MRAMKCAGPRLHACCGPARAWGCDVSVVAYKAFLQLALTSALSPATRSDAQLPPTDHNEQEQHPARPRTTSTHVTPTQAQLAQTPASDLKPRHAHCSTPTTWLIPNRERATDENPANFFFIALFFSYFRSSMISLVFTKVGHRFIRQMRLRHILSGGHDYTPFEAADARRPHYSHPPDSIAAFEAGQHLSKPAVSTRSVGATSTGTAASRKRCAPPARQRTPPLAFASLSLCSSLFSLLSFSYNLSFCYLVSSILIAFLDQNQ
jgi:hypothetical protein